MRRDDDLFLRLLLPEQGRLMRIALALTGQEADAWDLLQRRNRTVHLEVVGETDPDPSPGPEERLEQSQLWEQVTALEEHHRHVLVLRFLVDMPVEEIAEVLGVPPGTVKSRIHRALAALRRRMVHESKGAAHQ